MCASSILKRLSPLACCKTAASCIPLSFLTVAIMAIYLLMTFGRTGPNGSAKIGKLSPCFVEQEIFQPRFHVCRPPAPDFLEMNPEAGHGVAKDKNPRHQPRESGKRTISHGTGDSLHARNRLALAATRPGTRNRQTHGRRRGQLPVAVPGVWDHGHS